MGAGTLLVGAAPNEAEVELDAAVEPEADTCLAESAKRTRGDLELAQVCAARQVNHLRERLLDIRGYKDGRKANECLGAAKLNARLTLAFDDPQRRGRPMPTPDLPVLDQRTKAACRRRRRARPYAELARPRRLARRRRVPGRHRRRFARHRPVARRP